MASTDLLAGLSGLLQGAAGGLQRSQDQRNLEEQQKAVESRFQRSQEFQKEQARRAQENFQAQMAQEAQRNAVLNRLTEEQAEYRKQLNEQQKELNKALTQNQVMETVTVELPDGTKEEVPVPAGERRAFLLNQANQGAGKIPYPLGIEDAEGNPIIGQVDAKDILSLTASTMREEQQSASARQDMALKVLGMLIHHDPATGKLSLPDVETFEALFQRVLAEGQPQVPQAPPPPTPGDRLFPPGSPGASGYLFPTQPPNIPQTTPVPPPAPVPVDPRTGLPATSPVARGLNFLFPEEPVPVPFGVTRNR